MYLQTHPLPSTKKRRKKKLQLPNRKKTNEKKNIFFHNFQGATLSIL